MAAELTLTDMTEAQLDRVVNIWTKGWTQGHAAVVPQELVAIRTPESFHIRMAKQIQNTRVILSGATVLGFCIRRDAEIYQMYVSAEAQGTGAAQKLMADAETHIRAAGHNTAWLDCAVGNGRAARFYEKSGWVNKGVQSTMLDTLSEPFKMDIWRFEKPLTPST